MIIRSIGDPNLQAVVFWGFPRTEQETLDCRQTIFHDFDVLYELTNLSEEAEDDDEDEFLQSHLDAVEVLREYYLNNNHENVEPFSHSHASHGSEKESRASWKKISYEKDSYQTQRNEDLQKFLNALAICLDDRRLRVEATKAINAEKPPRANGFAVTALCLYEDVHSRAIDLIKYAFEQHPDLDYCLYMLPCQDPPSLLTHCFNYVESRQSVSFDQSLYILHRAYFYALEHMKVERLHISQLNDVYSFLQPIRQRDRQDVIESTQRSIDNNDVDLAENPSEVTFLVTINNKIVGLMNYSRKMLTMEDIVWYRDHYHLDDYISLSRHRLKNQYMMSHFYIDTVFSSLARMVLNDVMRYAHKTVFYHHLDKLDAPSKEILETFTILRPRRRPQGDFGDTARRPKHPTSVVTFQHDCPLFFVSKCVLSRRKDIVAKRVVIIGGSCHAYSFLETLSTVPDAYFPNIYLVLAIPPPPLKDASSFEYESAEESKHDEEYSGCLSLQVSQVLTMT